MSLNELREAQARFERMLPAVIMERQELYDLRNKFVKYYTPKRIKTLDIDHFALGNDLLPNGLLFCYTLERGLDGLGRTTGATASKFGVYWGRTKSDPTKKYRFTKKFGTNLNTAYQGVIESILDLLEAGRERDLERIAENKLSPMFKGKILCTYYPESYLNIFSNEHLNHYLIQFNLDNEEILYKDEVYKREELLKFKNSDKVMKKWSADMFAYFLYRVYPLGPNDDKYKSSADLKDFEPPVFPPDPEPVPVKLLIGEPDAKTESEFQGSGGEDPDYEKQAKRLKQYGNRGEKIVFDMERKKLIEAGKRTLANNVKKADRDSDGYDIKSFEIDGTPKYIEVKATTAKAGDAKFFLSRNEKNKASTLPNYFVYVVFEILSQRPKVWEIPNPFHPANPKVKLEPMTYQVTIKAIPKPNNS